MRESSFRIEMARQSLLVSFPLKTAVMRVFTERPLHRFPLQELSTTVQQTPAAVVEVIMALQQEGVRIGMAELSDYFYDPDDSILHPDQVAAHLTTRWWGQRIYYGERLTSTIDIAKALAIQPKTHGSVILANEQMRGRGRQGNAWVSPRGRDLLLTFLIQFGEWEPSPSLMSLYTTTAVARVLDTAYGIPIAIKWPNDLVVNDCKLGGVLVERDPYNRVFLVSLGLNVHSAPEDWPQELKHRAASLARIKNEPWPRDYLLAQCGTTWETLWESLLRDRGETVRGYWKRYSNTLGRRITLIHRGQSYQGLAKDIDDLGRLIFISETQGEMTLLAEEVQQVRAG